MRLLSLVIGTLSLIIWIKCVECKKCGRFPVPEKWLVTSAVASASICCFLPPALPAPAYAAPSSLMVALTGASTEEDLTRLKKGLGGLDILLSNWAEKTTYCNFGELNREILAVENKEALEKAAAECGLLDYACQAKTMNVKCKRDPQVVRAYLGLEPSTGNTLLYRADTFLKSKAVLELVDPDQYDDYFESVEKYQEAVAAADSLAYAARTDFGSTENRSLSESKEAGVRDGKEDFLQQSKTQVAKARDALRQSLTYLITE